MNNCEKVFRRLWESLEKVVRKLWEICEKVMRKLWESCEKIERKFWECCEKVLRKSTSLLQMQTLAGMFVLVCYHGTLKKQEAPWWSSQKVMVKKSLCRCGKDVNLDSIRDSIHPICFLPPLRLSYRFKNIEAIQYL